MSASVPTCSINSEDPNNNLHDPHLASMLADTPCSYKGSVTGFTTNLTTL